MTQKFNATKEVKKVLREEGRAIVDFATRVGPSFGQAIQALRDCKGKVVVTGIGKSGLIAQKISATFSSTGTRSIYLHPAEAMHGNLGALEKKDLVLAIGKSGESDELLGILPALRKIGVKVISLTGIRNSTLAKKSDIVLYVPVKKESCPLNLAPTTSAILALAVGDALAIILMKLKGFDTESFALYHPGGLLGKRLLLTVKDVMRKGKENPVVKINATMSQLMIEISKKWTGACNVVDKKGKLIGLVTDFDIRRAFARGKKITDLTIPEIMNPDPISCLEDEMAATALSIMESRGKPLTVLPIVNKKRKSVGMIHLHDLVAKGLAPSGKRKRNS